MMESIIIYIQTAVSIGGFLVMLWAYVKLSRMGNPANIAKTIDILKEKYVSRPQLYDLAVEMLINLMEDEELKAKVEKLLNDLLKSATKGAVQGAMPKIKLEDALGYVILQALGQKLPFGQQGTQPQGFKFSP